MSVAEPENTPTGGATRADWLLLAVLGVVVLLTPDVGLGPYQAINPQSIARIVLVVLGIGAAGYYAQRALGQRHGLLVAGFVAGFVSSSATIASMGLRAKADPSARNAAVAGGLASSVATVVFYSVIIAAVDKALVVRLALPLGLASLTALATTFTFARARAAVQLDVPKGRAFQWLPALLIGLASMALAVVGAALSEKLGGASMVVVSAVAGLVDAHATSASVATLHHNGRLDSESAMLAVVVALSVNTVTKIVMASLSRDRGYALRLSAGVIAIALAAWLGLGIAIWW
ncbi:MAG: DUF4010 domain-containing protein [Sandaracinaceae bacterium]|nr:DUF4010 domain-containing protein [Sandaracinaceae bacterium]MBP7680694.1 DUF4010 domain-containing protein [Deltaproteobacteria bacterium]MBK6812434.1 DUF4010 domain-containing protein [Sandaracinaceae bacterium]MBK7150713.1 DUF4010 domain-containing protein [Sandaracinaceae bacterium]MBK7777610.1 DUF4010 domain-containing protein [Sandaracinaceae bacterium]